MPINKGAKYYKLNISKIVNCQTRQRAQIKKRPHIYTIYTELTYVYTKVSGRDLTVDNAIL